MESINGSNVRRRSAAVATHGDMPCGGAHATIPSCVVVDDHELIRRSLTAVLEDSYLVNVVGQADSAREALEILQVTKPDIVILDLRLPDGDGIALTEQLRLTGLCSKILIMSGDAGLPLVESALLAGADGFVSKLSGVDVVLAAVRVLQANKRFIDPSVACELIDPQRIRLTDREQEVVELLVEGCQNGEIAFRLSVGTDTVKSHVSSIFTKMGVASRSGAATKAIREGFVL